MSQSANLYRISQEYFNKLESSGLTRKFEINSSKNYSIFEGSFMALEYILSKGRNETESELIKEIFNPQNVIGSEEFKNLAPEEQFKFYENGSIIPYLDTESIAKIDKILGMVSEVEVQKLYNSQELNENGIYPQNWHNDNAENLAYNEKHIIEDLMSLKYIFNEAQNENDYILVFVG
jgi:Domain of unknown function (DUF1877)